jgi:hypothetical protein
LLSAARLLFRIKREGFWGSKPFTSWFQRREYKRQVYGFEINQWEQTPLCVKNKEGATSIYCLIWWLWISPCLYYDAITGRYRRRFYHRFYVWSTEIMFFKLFFVLNILKYFFFLANQSMRKNITFLNGKPCFNLALCFKRNCDNKDIVNK